MRQFNNVKLTQNPKTSELLNRFKIKGNLSLFDCSVLQPDFMNKYV